MSQLELFSQSTKESNQGVVRSTSSFLRQIWNYEKLIFLILGFLVTAIISFSLGFEKGKGVSAMRNVQSLDMVQKDITLQNLAQPQTQKDIKITPEDKNTEIDIKEGVEKYTVQVASFASETYAQKEAQGLEKKGLTAMVLTKGKYSIVCVGNFLSREEARSFLSKLKDRYNDCFIRRL